MSFLPNFIADLLSRLVALLRGDNAVLLLFLILALVTVTLLFLLTFLYLLNHYHTNTESFFKRQLKAMVKEKAVTEENVMLIPLVHGKKTIIPLEPGELLHFYMVCEYWFFRLSDQMQNVNIDLVVADKNTIKDFETVGRGRLFITSHQMMFENIRSRSLLPWSKVYEIRVKFDYLFLMDHQGCHAFKLETPTLVSNFIYNAFLKEV